MIQSTIFITEEYGSSDFPESDGTFNCLNDANDGDVFKVEGDWAVTNEAPVSSNAIGSFRRFNLPAQR